MDGLIFKIFMDANQKKKLLYITIRADFGGGPFHVDQLIENLDDSFDIYCAAPLEIPFGKKWKSKLGEGHFFELDHRRLSIKKLFRLISFIKLHRIKLIHSHGKGAGIYSRFIKILNPKLIIIHTFHGFHPYTKKLSDKIYIIFERLFGSLTNYFINVSNGERELCLKYGIVTSKKSQTIYNGIKDISYLQFDKYKLRSKLGLDKSNFVVVSISRFDQHKNINQILDIARKLEHYSKIQFVLVGDGEEKSKIELKTKQLALSNILFTGFKDNPLEYIAASDVYLATSKGEALGYSLIEAQMMGIPIIASNVMGHSEIITDGVNGFLFYLTDNDLAVSILLKIFNDESLSKQIAEQGINNYKKRFTLDLMINQILSLYTRFLN
jgi:glycosyltransferase involved in cell wall biosynthesis